MYIDSPAEQTEKRSRRHRHPPIMGSRAALIRLSQEQRGEEPCFRTDKRLLCRRDDCEWRSECRRLVAAWKR